MSQKVDLYDTAYGNYESKKYRQVRIETYGEDFGQTSWVTTEESKEIPLLLNLSLNSSVLEFGVRVGGYALHLAEKAGCRLVGLDTIDLCISNRKYRFHSISWGHEASWQSPRAGETAAACS